MRKKADRGNRRVLKAAKSFMQSCRRESLYLKRQHGGLVQKVCFSESTKRGSHSPHPRWLAKYLTASLCTGTDTDAGCKNPCWWSCVMDRYQVNSTIPKIFLSSSLHLSQQTNNTFLLTLLEFQQTPLLITASSIYLFSLVFPQILLSLLPPLSPTPSLAFPFPVTVRLTPVPPCLYSTLAPLAISSDSIALKSSCLTDSSFFCLWSLDQMGFSATDPQSKVCSLSWINMTFCIGLSLINWELHEGWAPVFLIQCWVPVSSIELGKFASDSTSSPQVVPEFQILWNCSTMKLKCIHRPPSCFHCVQCLYFGHLLHLPGSPSASHPTFLRNHTLHSHLKSNLAHKASPSLLVQSNPPPDSHNIWSTPLPWHAPIWDVYYTFLLT